MENKVDPFGMSEIKDYDKILREFGVSSFAPLVKKLPKPPAMMRRGFVFGHRDFERIADAIKNRKKFAVLTGIKPTNYLHIGSKFVIDELVYLQKHGGIVYYVIADLEALADNGISLEESANIARDNLLDVLALGLDPKKTVFYKQSENPTVLKYAQIFGSNVTTNMLKAIYGERETRLYMAALVQMADILLPQIEHGKIPTVIPVGFDQDPHIRLSRDIAKKHGLIPPSATYKKFIGSLTGNPKMSKREPEGIIFLNESPDSAAYKIRNKAKTGGRDTLEQQKRLGGRPELCSVFELYSYGLLNDKELAKVYKACKSGKLMCKDCKEIAVGKLTAFLKEHQRRRKAAEKIVDKILC